MSTEEDRANDIEFDELADYIFPYLDALREDGSINMFEAPRYVMEEYDISKDTSRKIVSSWMKSKTPHKTPT